MSWRHRARPGRSQSEDGQGHADREAERNQQRDARTRPRHLVFAGPGLLLSFQRTRIIRESTAARAWQWVLATDDTGRPESGTMGPLGISCAHVAATARIVVILLALVSTVARSRPHAQSDQFVLPDNLEISLWAESPMFFNPTNIDVDARGRVWVAEAVNYRDFNTAKQGPLTHPAGDRILILTDRNGDGRADSSKVFVQDKDLRAPLGLAVVGNRVVVSASPHLIVYTDENGDDTPDKKEILLTGFGGVDHDHGLHALVAGPDGRWYFNTGNAGPHIVTNRSGWTLRAGSLYTGGTPYNLKNQGGMMSDDGRVWTGGLGLRIEPDGKRLTVLAHNFRNAYELAVDSFGDLWQNDNDDQVMTCRTTWLMEGANAGYFSADGSRYWQADRRPGQDTFTAHWHQEIPACCRPATTPAPARRPASSATRATSSALATVACSSARTRAGTWSSDISRNRRVPASRSIGQISCRASPRRTRTTSGTRWSGTDASGSGRATWRSARTARSTWPTGTTDRRRPPDAGRQGHGRIYRITPKGRTLTTPSIDLSTTAGQIQALLSPAVNVRSSGFEGLKARAPRCCRQ